MTDQRFEVQNRAEESRYVLIDHESGGVIGEEDYVDVTADAGVQRVLFHTGVSDEYSGQGLASRLVRAVVDDVIAQGYAIVPVCPYVAAWLPKHPEYADHVVKPRPEHLRAVAAREK
ncbi:putative GNAT family acetyltransferase [Kribbella aluminosa]|uniref:GNAT family acetyltransferase n=1 Tax=Kribbella aluminosa TaxID=416017 RepID=A0ABS4ULP5_9ACTN|nr:GNAT family N-acetyltransferase [Kribbella aluminosa]MBP2352561.1 putative GNAT family acetyltransferase [Kribbella aluminosa]